MSVQRELREIRKILSEVNKKLDILIENRELVAAMLLSEQSLKEFFSVEPNIYTVRDLRVNYR